MSKCCEAYYNKDVKIIDGEVELVCKECKSIIPDNVEFYIDN